MAGDGRKKRLGAALAIALSPVALVAACVDGVTPDCSDAATPCGPSLDAGPERVEAALPEAARIDGAPEAAPDAPDLDAGDEG